MSGVIELAEMKMKTVQEVGRRLDEKQESAKVEVYRNEGARGVLTSNVLPGMEGVKSYWRKELDKEVLTPEVATLIFKAIDQCEGCVRNLIELSQAAIIRKQGEIEAYKMSIDMCEKTFAVENAKVKGLMEAMERGDVQGDTQGPAGRPPLRVVGLHPGGSIAAQRRAEGTAPTELGAESVVQDSPVRQADAPSTPVDTSDLQPLAGATPSLRGKMRKKRKSHDAENTR
jgi:hypothetical protein